MKTKGMAVWIAIAMLVFPVVAVAEWGISPTISADGRVDGAMASMNWSFGGGKSQEIILAKNVSRQQLQQSAVAKREAESQQFFSAEEVEKLVASIQLPPPVEGRRYLKIGSKPVDPKTFDFLKEDAHILLKDAEIKTADNNGKISIGWLRAGEILVTPKGETRAIRIWRCGNPILSELYIVAPKPVKVETTPIVAAIPAEIPAEKREAEKQNLFPQQSTIDKIADGEQPSADNTNNKWSTGKKVVVVAVIAAVVGAVAYTIDQQQNDTTTNTTTTTTVVVGQDPQNGTGPATDPVN